METSAKMNWKETLAIMGMFLGCFLFLLHRIDALESKSDAKFQAQSERSDRLYEVVIELLKQNSSHASTK